MSDNKTPAPGVSGTGEHPLIPHVKDAAIFLGWIAGLVLIAGLCWFFTQPVRNLFLQKAVNRVLEQSGDTRRLDTPLLIKTPSPLGSWFSVIELPGRQKAGNSSPVSGAPGSETGPFPEETKAFVFSFIGGGFFFPCVAIVTPEGTVKEFIPLGKYGKRMINQLSPGVLRIYTRRIEGAQS